MLPISVDYKVRNIGIVEQKGQDVLCSRRIGLSVYVHFFFSRNVRDKWSYCLWCSAGVSPKMAKGVGFEGAEALQILSQASFC